MRKDYFYELNSADTHDPDIPLIKPKAVGGTLILWKRRLDPYVEVQSLKSTSFLPIIFNPPGYSPSVHICTYLPTAGFDSQFLEEISKLWLIET